MRDLIYTICIYVNHGNIKYFTVLKFTMKYYHSVFNTNSENVRSPYKSVLGFLKKNWNNQKQHIESTILQRITCKIMTSSKIFIFFFTSVKYVKTLISLKHMVKFSLLWYFLIIGSSHSCCFFLLKLMHLKRPWWVAYFFKRLYSKIILHHT